MMTMKEEIADYHLDNESGIWKNHFVLEIPYNDGDEIEEHILSVLKQTQS